MPRSNFELDLGLRWLLNRRLRFFQLLLEAFLAWSQCDEPRRKRKVSHLQFRSQIIDKAPFFVEIMGIIPQETCPLLECRPPFKVADTRRGLASMDAFDLLLQPLERQRLGDDGKVLLIAARRQVDKVQEIWITVHG